MIQKITNTEIEGVKIVDHSHFIDDRGSFMEYFSMREFADKGLPYIWSQSNISISRLGVLRGLHSQTKDPQEKLVTCVSGRILDVVVDARPKSPTFMQHMAFPLSGHATRSILIAAGCLHGFMSLTNDSIVHYLCTTPYDADSAFSVNPFDPDLKIAWPQGWSPVMSDKDRKAQSLKDFIARNPDWS